MKCIARNIAVDKQTKPSISRTFRVSERTMGAFSGVAHSSSSILASLFGISGMASLRMRLSNFCMQVKAERRWEYVIESAADISTLVRHS